MTKTMSITMNNISDFQKFSQIAANSEHPVIIKSGSSEINAHSLLRIFTVDWTKPVDIEYNPEDVKISNFLATFKANVKE